MSESVSKNLGKVIQIDEEQVKEHLVLCNINNFTI
jgi:hypothetical protein